MTTTPNEFEFQYQNAFRRAVNTIRAEKNENVNNQKSKNAYWIESRMWTVATEEENREFKRWEKIHSAANPVTPKLSRFSSAPPPAFVSPSIATGIHSSVPASTSVLSSSSTIPSVSTSGGAGGKGVVPPVVTGGSGSGMIPPSGGTTSSSVPLPKKPIRVSNHSALSGLENNFVQELNQHLRANNMPYAVEMSLRPSTARATAQIEKRGNRLNPAIDPDSFRDFREKQLVIYETKSDGTRGRSTSFTMESVMLSATSLNTGKLEERPMAVLNRTIVPPTMTVGAATPRAYLPVHIGPEMAGKGDFYMDSFESALHLMKKTLDGTKIGQLSERWGEITSHLPTPTDLNYLGVSRMSLESGAKYDRKAAEITASYVVFERGSDLSVKHFRGLTQLGALGESGYEEGPSGSTHSAAVAEQQTGIARNNAILVRSLGNVMMSSGDDFTQYVPGANPANPSSPRIISAQTAKKGKKTAEELIASIKSKTRKKTNLRERQGYSPKGMHEIEVEEGGRPIGFTGVMVYASKTMQSGGVNPETGEKYEDFVSQQDPGGGGGANASTNVYTSTGRIATSDEYFYMPRGQNVDIRNLRIIKGVQQKIKSSGGTIADWGDDDKSDRNSKIRLPRMGYRGGVTIEQWGITFGSDQNSARQIKNLLGDSAPAVEQILSIFSNPNSIKEGNELYKERKRLEIAAVKKLNQIQEEHIESVYEPKIAAAATPEEADRFLLAKEQEIKSKKFIRDRVMGGKSGRTALVPVTSYNATPDSIKGSAIKAMLGHQITDPATKQAIVDFEKIKGKKIEDISLQEIETELFPSIPRSQHLADIPLQKIVANRLQKSLFGKNYQQRKIEETKNVLSRRTLSKNIQKMTLDRMRKKGVRSPEVPVISMTTAEIKNSPEWHLGTILAYRDHSAPGRDLGADDFNVSEIGQMLREEYKDDLTASTEQEKEQQLIRAIRSFSSENISKRAKIFENILEMSPTYGGRIAHLTAYEHFNVEPAGTTNTVNRPSQEALFKDVPGLSEYVGSMGSKAQGIVQMLMPTSAEEIVDIEEDELSMAIPAYWEAEEPERFDVVRRMFDQARARQNKSRNSSMRFLTNGADGKSKEIILASPYAFEKLERGAPGTTLTRLVERIQNPMAEGVASSSIEDMLKIHQQAVQEYANSDAGNKAMQNIGGQGIKGMAFRYISNPDVPSNKIWVGNKDVSSMAEHFGFKPKDFLQRLKKGQKFHIYSQRYPQATGSGAWYEIEHKPDYLGPIAVPTEFNYQVAGDDDGDLANFIAGFRQVTYKRDGKVFNEFVPLPGVETAVVEQNTPLLTSLNRFATFYGFKNLNKVIKEARSVMDAHIKDNLSYDSEFIDSFEKKYGKIDPKESPEIYKKAMQAERDALVAKALVNGFNFVNKSTNAGYHIKGLNVYFAGKDQRIDIEKIDALTPIVTAKNKKSVAASIAKDLGAQSVAMTLRDVGRGAVEESETKREMGVYTILKDLQKTSEREDHVRAVANAQSKLYGEYGGNLIEELGSSLRPQNNRYASSFVQASANLDWTYQRALDMLPKSDQSKSFSLDFFTSDIQDFHNLNKRQKITKNALMTMLGNEEVSPIAVGAIFGRRGDADHIAEITSLSEEIKEQIEEIKKTGKEPSVQFFERNEKFQKIVRHRRGDQYLDISNPDIDSAFMTTIRNQSYVNTIKGIADGSYDDYELDQKQRINSLLESHESFVNSTDANKWDWQQIASQMREGDTNGYLSDILAQKGIKINKELQHLNISELSKITGRQTRIDERPSKAQVLASAKIQKLNIAMKSGKPADWAEVLGLSSGSLSSLLSANPVVQSIYRRGFGSPESENVFKEIETSFRRSFNARASSLQSIANFDKSSSERERSQYVVGESNDVYKASAAFDLLNQSLVDLIGGGRNATKADPSFIDSESRVKALNLSRNQYGIFLQSSPALLSGDMYEKSLYEELKDSETENNTWLHMGGISMRRTAGETSSAPGTTVSGTPDFFKLEDYYEEDPADSTKRIKKTRVSVFDAKNTRVEKALEKIGYETGKRSSELTAEDIENAVPLEKPGTYSGQLETYVWLADSIRQKRAKAGLGSFEDLSSSPDFITSEYSREIETWAASIAKSRGEDLNTARKTAIRALEGISQGNIVSGGIISKNSGAVDRDVFSNALDADKKPMLKVSPILGGRHLLMSSRSLPKFGKGSIEHSVLSYSEKAQDIFNEVGLRDLAFMRTALHFAWANQREFLGLNRDDGTPDYSDYKPSDITPLFGMLKAQSSMAKGESLEHVASSGKLTQEAEETASVLSSIRQGSGASASEIANMEYVLRGYQRVNKAGKIAYEKIGNAVVGEDSGRTVFDVESSKGDAIPFDDIMLRETVVAMSSDREPSGVRTLNIADSMDIDGVRTTRLAYTAQQMRELISPSLASNATPEDKVNHTRAILESLMKTNALTDADAASVFENDDFVKEYESFKGDEQKVASAIQKNALAMIARKYTGEFERIAPNSAVFDGDSRYGYDNKSGMMYTRTPSTTEGARDNVTAYRVNPRLFRVKGMFETLETAMQRSALAILQNQQAEKTKPTKGFFDQIPFVKSLSVERFFKPSSTSKEAFSGAVNSISKKISKMRDLFAAKQKEEGESVNKWFSKEITEEYTGIKAFAESPDHRTWFLSDHLKPYWHTAKALAVMGVETGQFKKEDVDMDMVEAIAMTHDLMKARKTKKDKQDEFDASAKGIVYDFESDKTMAMGLVKNKMGWSDEKAALLGKHLTEMDMVKKEKWWKENPEAWKSLAPEVRIGSTADSLVHYTGGVKGFLNKFSILTAPASEKITNIEKLHFSNVAKMEKDARKILMNIKIGDHVIPREDVISKGVSIAYDAAKKETLVTGIIPSFLRGILENRGIPYVPFEPGKNTWQVINPDTGRFEKFTPTGKMHGGWLDKNNIDIVGEINHEFIERDENGNVFVSPKRRKNSSETVGEFGQEIVFPGEDGELYVSPNSATKRKDSESYRSQQRIRFGFGIARHAGGSVQKETGAVAGETEEENWKWNGLNVAPLGWFMTESERRLNVRADVEGVSNVDEWGDKMGLDKEIKEDPVEIAKKYFGEKFLSGVDIEYADKISNGISGMRAGGRFSPPDGYKLKKPRIQILANHGKKKTIYDLHTVFHEIGHYSSWLKNGFRGIESPEYEDTMQEEVIANNFSLKHLRKRLNDKDFVLAQNSALWSLYHYERFSAADLPDEVYKKERLTPVYFDKHSPRFELKYGPDRDDTKVVATPVFGWKPRTYVNFLDPKELESLYHRFDHQFITNRQLEKVGINLKSSPDTGSARAHGGPVKKGFSYVAGENETELYKSVFSSVSEEFDTKSIKHAYRKALEKTLYKDDEARTSRGNILGLGGGNSKPEQDLDIKAEYPGLPKNIFSNNKIISWSNWIKDVSKKSKDHLFVDENNKPTTNVLMTLKDYFSKDFPEMPTFYYSSSPTKAGAIGWYRSGWSNGDGTNYPGQIMLGKHLQGDFGIEGLFTGLHELGHFAHFSSLGFDNNHPDWEDDRDSIIRQELFANKFAKHYGKEMIGDQQPNNLSLFNQRVLLAQSLYEKYVDDFVSADWNWSKVTRADGGPTEKGKSYVVGENESELYNEAGLNKMNRPRAHEPEFGNPLSKGWSIFAGYRRSANKNSAADGAGWKLHLASKTENYKSVDKWLWHNSPYDYKLLSGGTPQESDFTIYIGAKDRATMFAKKIKSGLSDLLMFPGRAASKFGTDRLVNEVVSMRFDPLEFPGQGGYGAHGVRWFYGRNGIPYDIRGNQIAKKYARLKLGIGMPKGSEEDLLPLEKELDIYDAEQERYLAEKFPGIYDSLIERINKTKATNALWSRSNGGSVEKEAMYFAGEVDKEYYSETKKKEYEEVYGAPDEDLVLKPWAIKAGKFGTISERLLGIEASHPLFPRIKEDKRKFDAQDFSYWSHVIGNNDIVSSAQESDAISTSRSYFEKLVAPWGQRFRVNIDYSSPEQWGKQEGLIAGFWNPNSQSIAIRPKGNKNTISNLFTVFHEYGHAYEDLYSQYKDVDSIAYNSFDDIMLKELYADRFAVNHLLKSGLIGNHQKSSVMRRSLSSLMTYETGMFSKNGYVDWLSDKNNRPSDWLKNAWMPDIGPKDELALSSRFSRAFGGPVEDGKNIVGFVETITPQKSLIHSDFRNKEIIGEFGQEIISPGEDGKLYVTPNSAIKRKNSDHYKSQERIRYGFGIARISGGPVDPKTGAVGGESGKESYSGFTDASKYGAISPEEASKAGSDLASKIGADDTTPKKSTLSLSPDDPVGGDASKKPVSGFGDIDAKLGSVVSSDDEDFLLGVPRGATSLDEGIRPVSTAKMMTEGAKMIGVLLDHYFGEGGSMSGGIYGGTSKKTKGGAKWKMNKSAMSSLFTEPGDHGTISAKTGIVRPDGGINLNWKNAQIADLLKKGELGTSEASGISNIQAIESRGIHATMENFDQGIKFLESWIVGDGDPASEQTKAMTETLKGVRNLRTAKMVHGGRSSSTSISGLTHEEIANQAKDFDDAHPDDGLKKSVSSFADQLSRSANLLKSLNENIDKMVGSTKDADKTWKSVSDHADALKKHTEVLKKGPLAKTPEGARMIRLAEEEESALRGMLTKGGDLHAATESKLGEDAAEGMIKKYGPGRKTIGRKLKDPMTAAFTAHFIRDMGYALREGLSPIINQTTDYGIAVNRERQLLAPVGESISSANDPASKFVETRRQWNYGMGRDAANMISGLQSFGSSFVNTRALTTTARGINQVAQPSLAITMAMAGLNAANITKFTGPQMAIVAGVTAALGTGLYSLGSRSNPTEMAVADSIKHFGGNVGERSFFTALATSDKKGRVNNVSATVENAVYDRTRAESHLEALKIDKQNLETIKSSKNFDGQSVYQKPRIFGRLIENIFSSDMGYVLSSEYASNKQDRVNELNYGLVKSDSGVLQTVTPTPDFDKTATPSPTPTVEKKGGGKVLNSPVKQSFDERRENKFRPTPIPDATKTPMSTRVPVINATANPVPVPKTLADPIFQTGPTCTIAAGVSMAGPFSPENSSYQNQKGYEKAVGELKTSRSVKDMTDFLVEKGDAALKAIEIPLKELETGRDAQGNPSKYANRYPQLVAGDTYYQNIYGYGDREGYSRNQTTGHALVRIGPNFVQNTNETKKVGKALYLSNEALFQSMSAWAIRAEKDKPGEEDVTIAVPDPDSPNEEARNKARDFYIKNPHLYGGKVPDKNQKYWDKKALFFPFASMQKRVQSSTPAATVLPTNTALIAGTSEKTAVPIPPTVSPMPPTATSVPPTATKVPPTTTSAPPTATYVPPTATYVLPTTTKVPSTVTSVPPTTTSVPPTVTKVPPTTTSVPPTNTTVPPTATSVSPTKTSVPPTNTSVPPTATSVLPTATSVPPTATSVPPTLAPATATNVPPTATSIPRVTNTSVNTITLTATTIPPTNTLVPPSATFVPPTNTVIPPTSTLVLPTTTKSAPTNTPAETSTSEPISTSPPAKFSPVFPTPTTAQITATSSKISPSSTVSSTVEKPTESFAKATNAPATVSVIAPTPSISTTATSTFSSTLGVGGTFEIQKQIDEQIKAKEQEIKESEYLTFQARIKELNAKDVERISPFAIALAGSMPEFDRSKSVDDLTFEVGMPPALMRQFRKNITTAGGGLNPYTKYFETRGIDISDEDKETIAAVAQIYGGNPSTERYSAFFTAAADRFAVGEDLEKSISASMNLGRAMGQRGFYGGSSFFADRSITGTLLTDAQQYDATENAQSMRVELSSYEIAKQTGASQREIAKGFIPKVFKSAYSASEAEAIGSLSFAELMQKHDINRLKTKGIDIQGLDIEGIMSGELKEKFNYQEWRRSGASGSPNEFVPATKAGYMKAASLRSIFEKDGAVGLQRLNKLGFSTDYLNSVMTADKSGYVTQMFAGVSQGDPFSISAAYNTYANQPGMNLGSVAPTVDFSTGTSTFQHSIWGLSVPRMQKQYALPKEIDSSGVKIDVNNPFTLQVPASWDKMSLAQKVDYNQQNAVPLMREYSKFLDRPLSEGTIAAFAGTKYTAIKNGEIVPLGGIAGGQKDLRIAQANASLASAGASIANMKLQREFDLSFARPMEQYQSDQKWTSVFGGTVESPFGNGTLNFGKGQLEYRRLEMGIQYKDMVANYQQNMARLGWQGQDLKRNRARQLVQVGYQAQDFDFQQRGIDINRESQSYDFAFQAREMGISKQAYKEDFSYGRKMSQLQFGWQMEDADTNIRRSTGFERRQLIKNREREVITFNSQTEQAQKENKRQEDSFKRQEEKFAKELDHYKKSIKLEDDQFKVSKERFVQQQKWEEEDFNIQTGRHDQEVAWAEEQFERQMTRFDLEKEQFELDAENQEKLRKDEQDYRQAAWELADKTYKHNLAAAGAAAAAALKAVEVETAITEITTGLELAVGAMSKFYEVRWEEVGKAMEWIIKMYKLINNIPDDPTPGKPRDPFPAEANGGYFNHNQSVLVGERGPEIITTDNKGRPFVIPNSAIPRGRPSSSGSSEVIHIHVMMDSDEIATYTAGKANTLASRNRRRAFNG
jgi:hypothetical protein